MRGELSHETVVPAAASAVWAVYRGLQLGRVVDEQLRDVIGRVEVAAGDGGVGTIMKVTYPPGTPGVGYMKEKYTRIDDEKRVKETEVFEGGPISAGFDLYRVRLEILEKDAESAIVRSTVEYVVDDKFQDDAAPFLTTTLLGAIAEAVGTFLTEEEKNITADDV